MIRELIRLGIDVNALNDDNENAFLLQRELKIKN